MFVDRGAVRMQVSTSKCNIGSNMEMPHSLEMGMQGREISQAMPYPTFARGIRVQWQLVDIKLSRFSLFFVYI